MTNLDIIRVGGELYAASEGDGGRRGGKETSTVNLEDGRDENELDEYDIMLLVSKCFPKSPTSSSPSSSFSFRRQCQGS